jgi:hypothetical protein
MVDFLKQLLCFLTATVLLISEGNGESIAGLESPGVSLEELLPVALHFCPAVRYNLRRLGTTESTVVG